MRRNLVAPTTRTKKITKCLSIFNFFPRSFVFQISDPNKNAEKLLQKRIKSIAYIKQFKSKCKKHKVNGRLVHTGEK